MKKIAKASHLSQIKRMEHEKKEKLALIYKQKWNVKVKNFKGYTSNQLEEILSKKASASQQRKAVITIQTAFRAYIQRKRFNALITKRSEAARFIQKVYKRYRMITMVPKAWRAKKFKLMSLIQRYIRGYFTFHKVRKDLHNAKLKNAFDYFDNIKNDLLSNSQIIIRYNWMKFKKLQKKKNEKKKQKKKITREPSVSSVSSIGKPRAGSVSVPLSPSKSSFYAGSTKKVPMEPIPELQNSNLFKINLQSASFMDNSDEYEIKLDL